MDSLPARALLVMRPSTETILGHSARWTVSELPSKHVYTVARSAGISPNDVSLKRTAGVRSEL